MNKKTILIVALLSLAALSATNDAMKADEQSADPVVLINPFIVPEDKLDETIAMWEHARDFLQKEPGYISTALHQSRSSDAQFRLINVAQWESAESYRAATKKMHAQANLPGIAGVRPGPGLYDVIRRD